MDEANRPDDHQLHDSNPPPEVGSADAVAVIARPLAKPGSTARQLADFDIFLFPLSRRQALFDVAGILLLAFFFEVLLGLFGTTIARAFYNLPLDDPEQVPAYVRQGMLFPLLGVRAVVTVGLVALFVWSRRQRIGVVGLKRRGLAVDGLLGVALTAVVYGVIALVLLGLMFAWPELPKQMQDNATGLLEIIPRCSPLVLLCMSAVIGVYEELLFRGFLMLRLRRVTGSWFFAVVLNSALFTALHAMDQTPAALVIVAILSLSFSLTTIWRRSIVPAMIAHALFDFSQLLLLSLQRDGVVG